MVPNALGFAASQLFWGIFSSMAEEARNIGENQIGLQK